jgi:dTDP-4-dehydrorhamnose 3,5-epimerase
MKFTFTEILGIIIIEPEVFDDDRGYFYEAFQEQHFFKAGIPTFFVQDNQSGSKQGVIRGLHYQIHQEQGKLIRVVAGEIFDVVVDLRKKSPSCGKWNGLILSSDNKLQVWIPPGFAHGFYVLSNWAEVLYKTTDYYAPKWERTLVWNDTTVNVNWPLIKGQKPIISQKDLRGSNFEEIELFE